MIGRYLHGWVTCRAPTHHPSLHFTTSQVRYWCMECLAFSACCTWSKETESQERKDKRLECVLTDSFTVKKKTLNTNTTKTYCYIFFVSCFKLVLLCFTFSHWPFEAAQRNHSRLLSPTVLSQPDQGFNPENLFWWDLHLHSLHFLVYVI